MPPSAFALRRCVLVTTYAQVTLAVRLIIGVG